MSINKTLKPDDLNLDPYPIYDELRKTQPVCFAKNFSPPGGQWLVTRFEDVKAVFTDTERFAQPNSGPNAAAFEGSILTLDGEEHRRVRKVVQAALNNEALSRLVEPVVRRVADELLTPIVADSKAELVDTFVRPLSIQAFGLLWGLDPIPVEKRLEWNRGFYLGFNNYNGDPETNAIFERARTEMEEQLPKLLRSMTQDQIPRVLPALVFSELTIEEVVLNTRIFMVSQMESGDLLGLVTWALLSHPEQAAEAMAKPTPQIMRRAIDEALRWASTLGVMTRRTKCPVSIGGVDLPEGALVGAVIAAANRDDEKFTAPYEFRLDRREGTHISFGAGPHACPGASISRQIASVAASALFERLPNLRFARDSPPFEMKGWASRPVSKLWLEWDRR